MNRRLRGIEMSSDSELSDDPQKTGYELTEFMKEFNAKTKMDYTKGYDPKQIDDHYRETNPLYERHDTSMPREFGFTFDAMTAGIGLNTKLKNEIEDCLAKFQRGNSSNFRPREIQK